MSKRNLVVAGLLAVFCLGGLAAGEEPAPPPKVIVRERTVYVPYEKLKETFDKEGRGVFLPYEEFLKLWNAGQPKEKPPEDIKPPAESVISGGAYTGVAKEQAVRFDVTYKIKALGKAWSECALPLKNVAVETVTVSDPQAVLAPKGDGYVLIMPKPGEYTLTLAFSVRVDSKPGQRKIEFGIPPTAVSRLELTIPEKDLRVEVMPKMAATVATPEGNATKVLAFVGNADQVTVTWMPPVSKVEKGEALTTASQLIHVELEERVLRVDTSIAYRIERNEEEQFRIRVPADMRLLSVKGNNIKEWNTEAGVLAVRLHSPVKETYALALRFERVLDKTPEKLDVPFPALVGVLREDGFVTLAHEAGLRLIVETSTGLSQVDLRELPDPLKRANLLAGFRYFAQPLALGLKIETVKPQIQSDVKAVVSLGLDEDAMTGWVDYQITKVGIFALKLKFESRWEPATIGEPQTVEDFQTAVEGQHKVITVNLKNKALGNFRLPFKLTGSGRAAPGEITLEPVQVVDTQQDKGLFGISALKQFKLTTEERNKMSSANIQLLVASGLLSQLPADFEMPLAYSYNQQPASVKIKIERRATQVRVTGYHSVIIAEGGWEMTHKLEYLIEFAGVDKLRFSAPSALDEKLLDVKCPGFKERKKAGEKGGRTIWEISLQDKMLGPVPITITHKENLKGLAPGTPQQIAIPDIRAEDVDAESGFLTVRKEAGLEIKAEAAGFETIEPVNLPAEMRSSNVYLAYRYVEPERKLTLTLTRHEALEVATLIVNLMRLTFVVSEERKLTVRADLWVQNAKGEQFLRLKLGDKEHGAEVRGVSVGGNPVSPLKGESGETLVKLSAGGGPFPVQIVYALPLDQAGSKLGAMGGLALSGPEVLSQMGDATAPKPQAAPRRVPVNKIEADLYVPEDYAYMGFSGTLHPRPSTDSNTLRWVQEFFAGQREQEVDRGETHGFQAPVLGGFVTQGRLFRFQTLAPVATVSLTYCDRKLFSAFDLLVVLAVLLLAFYLTSERLRAKEPVSGGHARLPLPRLWVCVAFVLIPLCLGWFATSDAGELLRAWFWAGVLFSAFALVVWGRQRWRAWQELRLATAPDPFLEEAEGPPKPASGIDGQASSSTPTEASPGEEPEKAGEGGDEKKEDQK